MSYFSPPFIKPSVKDICKCENLNNEINKLMNELTNNPDVLKIISYDEFINQHKSLHGIDKLCRLYNELLNTIYKLTRMNNIKIKFGKIEPRMIISQDELNTIDIKKLFEKMYGIQNKSENVMKLMRQLAL